MPEFRSNLTDDGIGIVSAGTKAKQNYCGNPADVLNRCMETKGSLIGAYISQRINTPRVTPLRVMAEMGAACFQG